MGTPRRRGVPGSETLRDVRQKSREIIESPGVNAGSEETQTQGDWALRCQTWRRENMRTAKGAGDLPGLVKKFRDGLQREGDPSL